MIGELRKTQKSKTRSFWIYGSFAAAFLAFGVALFVAIERIPRQLERQAYDAYKWAQFRTQFQALPKAQQNQIFKLIDFSFVQTKKG